MGLGIIALSFSINWASLMFTTQVCWLLTAHTVAAFGTFAVACGMSSDFGRLRPQVPRPVHWQQLINVLVFNSGGFDSAGSLVEFVKNPGRTVPLTVAAVNLSASVASGLVLALAYAGARGSSAEWEQGYFAVVAGQVGGAWLQWWVVLAAGLCNLQTYIATMAQACYMVCAMAENGVLPRGLGRAAPGRPPLRALSLCGCLSALFLLVPFYANLSLQSILYSLCLFVEVLCIMAVPGRVTYVPTDRRIRFLTCASPLLISGGVLAAQDSLFLGATFATCAAGFCASWALTSGPAGPAPPKSKEAALPGVPSAPKPISL